MLFNRKFALEIKINNTVKTYEATKPDESILNVDFNITKTIGGIGETADITVYGLTLDDIKFLCSSIILHKSNPTDNTIKISAGYPNDYGIIFKGSIFGVEPDLSSSDLSIKLSCNGSKAGSGVFQYSGENVSYAQVAKEIADFFECPCEIKSKEAPSLMLSNPSFSCSGLQAIDQLRGYAKDKLDIFISGGTLTVCDSDSPMENPIFLSANSGLVGVPKPMIDGAVFTSILRPSLQAGKLVSVQSEKLQMTSALYKIVNLKHHGSSRGSEFYSEITGKKVNVG